MPWLRAAVADLLGLLLALRRVPVVARRLSRRAGAAAPPLWFNPFGMTDLVVSVTLGALTGFALINVTRRGRRSASSRSR